MLLATGMRLIAEDAWWDAEWGTGKDGKGRNKLGICLMAIRKELRTAVDSLGGPSGTPK